MSYTPYQKGPKDPPFHEVVIEGTTYKEVLQVGHFKNDYIEAAVCHLSPLRGWGLIFKNTGDQTVQTRHYASFGELEVALKGMGLFMLVKESRKNASMPHYYEKLLIPGLEPNPVNKVVVV